MGCGGGFPSRDLAGDKSHLPKATSGHVKVVLGQQGVAWAAKLLRRLQNMRDVLVRTGTGGLRALPSWPEGQQPATPRGCQWRPGPSQVNAGVHGDLATGVAVPATSRT